MWTLTLPCFLIMVLYLKLRKHPRFPPGPTSLPILGHISFLSLENRHIVLHDWSKVYGANHLLESSTCVSSLCHIGDIIGLNVLHKSIIVLNSEEAANDLLDKRSGIYSDRPRFPMLEL